MWFYQSMETRLLCLHKLSCVITRFSLTLCGNEIWLHQSMETRLLHNHKLNFVITMVTSVLIKPAITMVWQTGYHWVKLEVTVRSKCESPTLSHTKGIMQGWKIEQDVVKSVQQWQYKVTDAKMSRLAIGKLESLLIWCPGLFFCFLTYGEQ